MTLEFNATLRDKGLGNDDKKKILLEVPVSELKGKVEELTSFANKTVTIQVVPQYYTYSIPFDKSTNAPTQEYVVNNDGTIDLFRKSRLNLKSMSKAISISRIDHLKLLKRLSTSSSVLLDHWSFQAQLTQEMFFVAVKTVSPSKKLHPIMIWQN